MKNITVLGGGSWATAIIKILCESSDDININWWIRTKEEANYISKFKHLSIL